MLAQRAADPHSTPRPPLCICHHHDIVLLHHNIWWQIHGSGRGVLCEGLWRVEMRFRFPSHFLVTSFLVLSHRQVGQRSSLIFCVYQVFLHHNYIMMTNTYVTDTLWAWIWGDGLSWNSAFLVLPSHDYCWILGFSSLTFDSDQKSRHTVSKYLLISSFV